MNINERLSIIAKQTPNHIAYIFKDKATSYAEFKNQVDSVSQGFAKLGYRHGDHLALIAWNNPHYLITMYGALQLGIDIIPINQMYTINVTENIGKEVVQMEMM